MKAVKVFLGVDMRVSHDGLKAHAKRHKIDLTKLKTGEVALFISNDKRRLKAYAWNGVLSYIRSMEIQRPIDLSAINEIAKTVKPDGTISYSDALRISLEKRLKNRTLGDELL